MNIPDSRTEGQNDHQGSGKPEADFQHLKEGVTEAIGDARQQADAQFGQYRDTAADQIEALAKGAKSFVSEIEDKDTLGMSDYLADMAESMTGLAGNLRGKSAEQLLHDAADLARNNPALFLAGSVALGFGLSRFLKAGTTAAYTASPDKNPAGGSSMPPSGGFGAHRPYETSVASNAGLDTGITPSAPGEQDHPTDFATPATPGSNDFKGAL
ncbi:hypothetical protein [Pseudomonas sp. LB3P31]